MEKTKVPSVEEILNMIKGKRDYAHAHKMYELGRELGCEIDPRVERDNYKIHFRLKHHDRDLYVLECGEDDIRVTASLEHIDKYKDTLGNCTKKVKMCVENAVTSAQFALDNKVLDRAGQKQQIFQDMRTPDWCDVVELIRREHRFCED